MVLAEDGAGRVDQLSAMRMRIAIIGAGAAGLSAAYDLSRAGHRVTVFEAAPSVGGLASGFKAPHWEWTLEKFYHHWFASDAAVLGLIKELGWSDEVLFPRPVTAMYHDGRFYAFDSALAVLRFPGIPFVDRVRCGVVALYLRLTPRWEPLERVTADAWLRKWLGPRAYECMWKPMLVGKFGEENLQVVNMAWFWARVHARTPRLGTFKGGFQAFMDKLAQVIAAQGAEIRLGSPVKGIEKRADGTLRVATADDTAGFDAIISTCSPALMADITPDLPAAYAAQLRALKSLGAVVMVFALDRQLTNGIYWHNLPKGAGFPFLAMVEHTNYMSPEHYGGDHIVYCGDYLHPSHEYFRLAKEELLERFLPALERFNPQFDRRWVKQSWLWRSAYAQPVPSVNHSRNIPPIRTPVRGLYFASMSQVYPWDRGTNFAVEIGRKAAKMVTADFAAHEAR
jgi:protoporphyrinogen oxidase